MKKILSLTLAVLMVVSMVPTAFAADVDYKNGTEVEYTGTRSTVEDDGSVTHNAEYTITVPALLAPGGSGTVTLEGYWPSDATVKVTAEDKVEMVNNINSADKKELAVTFASIEKAGSNTAIVTASAPVSVADISNALFGTWAGKFNYNVEYDGEAGGSGTVTPTPDPEEPSDPDTGDGEETTTIKFAINRTKGTSTQAQNCTADTGMTWAEWLESDYHGQLGSPYYISDNQITIDVLTDTFFVCDGDTPVSPDDVIIANKSYTANVHIVEFTIQIIPDGSSTSQVQCQAEWDMTWGEWVESDYNTVNASISNDGTNYILVSDCKVTTSEGHYITSDMKFILDSTYVASYAN